MRQRVVVTGMGLVSPIGSTVATFTENLLAGVSGVGPITLFDPVTLPTRIAAEVKWEGPPLTDRKIGFALAAAEQACLDAHSCGTRPIGDGGLSLGVGLELFRMEDLVASRRPGFALPETFADRLSFLQTPSDLAVHAISHRYCLHTPPLTHVSACAAGTDAIGAAFRLIARGARRWMLAGGTDSMINPLGVAGFCGIRATTTSNAFPARASRPFDRARDGFVLGEGAGILVLERLDDALARGARIAAEIVGYGNSFDAHGISEPHPDGRGAYQAMARALDDGGVDAAVIDCINAHGTSTRKNDPVETAAVKRLLGQRAYAVPMCATKSMIGHLISAAGAVEAIAAIVCMRAGSVHPTINLDDPDPACDLDYVAHKARPHRQRYVLSNSFGFGGQNAALVFKAFDDGGVSSGMIYELMKSRRSVRRFKPERPDRKQIELLLEAAITAPSASNKQPWRFLVVTNATVIARMAAVVREAVDHLARHIAPPYQPAFRAYGDYFTRFEEAPAVIVPLFSRLTVLSNLVDAELDAEARERIAVMEQQSGLIGVALAMQNAMLMAPELGLGTSGMTGPLVAAHRLREILEVAPSWDIAALLPVGVPAESPLPTARKPLSQVIRWIE